MANKKLFRSAKSHLPTADAVNQAGGLAYALSPKHALAQLAATGCFNGTFYADATDQLDRLEALAGQVDDALFLAKLAVYSRRRAFMKDMPAALLLLLAKRDTVLFQRAFDRVVDNGRILRTTFQMVRSGRFGRKGLSASLQRAFQRWLNQASPGALLSASIGRDPSLRDVLRMARPTPADNSRRALFGWLTDKPQDRWAPATADDLPADVKALAAYRAAPTESEQVAILKESGGSLRWDLLADAAKGPAVWKAIARLMGPQALRMNLNTLQRHGVLADPVELKLVVDRIGDAEEVRRSRQFPYQYLAAYLNAGEEIPQSVKGALAKAAEAACGSVPAMPGPVLIGLDVSGSMSSPITGHRARGSTSKVRCVDAAAVFAAAVLRRNPNSLLIPFDDRAHVAKVDPSDSILSLAQRLAAYGGGGTDCSIPLKEAVTRHAKRKLVGCVLVSDNMSWIGQGRHGSTQLMTAWREFVKNQVRLKGADVEGPKLVCLDLQPSGTAQAPESSDVLNVGGFSDAVFTVIASFLGDGPARFVAEVEAVEV
ncbi:MAG: TROVE domain-containing protein [Isosphaeraceae bacterium]